MRIEVIVTGAAGRMGSIISHLVEQDKEMNLVGMIETREKLSQLKGERVVCTSSLEEVTRMYPSAVIIDFTYPEVTAKNLKVAMENGNPLVIGTTGLNESQTELLEKAAQTTQVFWAPNMSVGINVLLRVLPSLVKMLGEDYDIEISEIHHRFKKDAPSGTALKLAQTLITSREWKRENIRYCREGMIGERPRQEIGVQTLRGGDVVGDHTVYFLGPGERIEITHRAHSRETFARGALRAAKWLVTKPTGTLYTMFHMLSE